MQSRLDAVEPGPGQVRRRQGANAKTFETAGKEETVAVAQIGEGEHGPGAARNGGTERRDEGERRGAAEGKKLAPIQFGLQRGFG